MGGHMCGMYPLTLLLSVDVHIGVLPAEELIDMDINVELR